jgi:hypothetical protein
MTSTRKPTVVLSLVKDNPTASKFISLEALPQEKKDLVQKYQKIIAPGSVLVGAVTQSGPTEDVRPVILQRGQMTVSRVFSPQLLGSISLTDSFKRYVFHIEQLTPGLQGIVCGSNEGIAWVTRKYFTHLLSDNAVEIPMTERPQLMSALLQYVEKLHAEGLIHGHIQPQNVALEKSKLILIDHGFQIYDPGSSHPLSLAPELRVTQTSVLSADIAADVYGLGLVAKRLFGGELAVEYGNLIEVLLLNDPKLRPTLSQVAKHFLPAQKEPVVHESNKPESKTTPIQKESATEEDGSLHPIFHKISSLISAFPTPTELAKYKWLILVGLLLISGLVYNFRADQAKNIVDVSVSEDKFSRLWESNQLPLMQQVVQMALQGNVTATQFLRKRLEDGGDAHQSIQKKFFLIAFHPLWTDEISENDFKALIIFGAPSLVPPSMRQAPDLSKLHPAVAFAIAATLSPSDNFHPLKEVSTKRLGELSGMYGSAFLALERLGVKDMSSSASQYLAHILSMDTSASVLSGFIDITREPKISFARLELLMPLLENIPGLGDAIMQAISIDSDHPLAWFGKDVVANWIHVTSSDKLGLFTGILPSKLATEQYVDLLRFPLVRIREQALEKILSLVGVSYRKFFEYLSSDECELTRTQSISLFSTVQVTGDRARLFSLQWFDTHPAPRAVVAILLRKPQPTPDEPFTIAGAKYLLNQGYKPTPEEIVGLLSNAESLVRAFAYSQLAVDKKEERILLEKFVANERNESLKKRQMERLESQ